MKNLLNIPLFILSFSASAFNFGHIDIDHSSQWRDILSNNKSPVSECIININDESFKLNDTNKFDDALKIISSFSGGKKLIEKYNDLIAKKELAVYELLPHVRSQFNLNHGVAALYVYEGELPAKIYVNSKDELGLLAIFLYHELSHAIDENIMPEYDISITHFNKYNNHYKELEALAIERGMQSYESIGDYLTEEEDNKLRQSFEAYDYINQNNSYRAERHAFDKQDEFTKYLFSFDSCYKSYIEEHKKKNKLKLYETTPDDHIFGAYGLSRDIVE